MARPSGKLSALQADRLSRKPGMHGDGAGLWLCVSSANAASWVFRYQIAKKPRVMGLGSFRDVPLAKARERVRAYRLLMTEGCDPITERDSAAAAKAAVVAGAMTFRQCATAFIEAQKAAWTNPKSPKQWTATLEAYAYPTIGDVAAGAVDVAMIHKILDPIWTAKPETAGRVRGRIESILDWAKTRGYRAGENPARWKGFLEHSLPGRSKDREDKHFAALPYDQIGAFLVDVRDEGGDGALALEFTILTTVRTGDTLGAAWPEFDLSERVWTIPAARTKGRRTHRVPLSEPAMAILRAQHTAAGGKGYVFPGARKGRPLSNMVMLMTLRRMKRDDLTTHGFRSTFRDWVAECTNYPNHVAEMALAHIIDNKVEAAYRRGDLFEKRRKLMDAWASYCSKPSNAGAIPIRRSAG